MTGDPPTGGWSEDDEQLEETTIATDGEPEATTLDTGEPSDEGDAEQGALRRGDLLGRYVIIEELGSGAMGVVYAAYDPDLDRRLAIKLLHKRAVEADRSRARTRLLREAQALARLSHPNVIAVHDVGMHDDRVFVAMAYVRGRTLRKWLEEERPDVDEVLGVFLRAGAGLAAAHRVDLIHRDFKPDNVMIGDDGRVHVLDFGLARAAGQDDKLHSSDLGDEEVRLTRSSSLNLDLTRSGRMLGTPAYMSAEQHVGLPATARSDQFAYCVALWEAICGKRPYTGRDLPSLSLHVAEGVPREPPSDRPIPGRVRKTLERGLKSDPDERWPDMETLLEQIRRDPAARRKKIMFGVGGVAALVAVVGVGVQREENASEACANAAAEAMDVWDANRADKVREAFAATAVPWAGDAAERVRTGLDDWALGWRDGYVEACEATKVRGEQSVDLLDRRMACLQRHRRGLAALVDRLEQADKKAVEHAVDAVHSLGRPSECGDLDLLLGEQELDEAMAEKAGQIEEALAKASALADLGDYERAREDANALIEEARALGHAPTLARVLLGAASYHGRFGDSERSIALAAEAAKVSDRAGADRLRAEAALSLASDIGVDEHRPEEGRLWLAVAEGVIERLGSPPELSARLYRVSGTVEQRAGEHAKSLSEYERALEEHGKAGPEDEASRIQTVHRKGISLRMLGRFDEAMAEHEKVLAAYEKSYGAQHPEVASALGSLANDAYSKGDLETSLGFNERAVAIAEAAFGRDSPTVANRLNNYAVVLVGLARFEDAEPLYREALVIFQREYGPDDPRITPPLENLGNVLSGLERFEEAAEFFRRSLTIKRATKGEDHPSTAMSKMNLGVSLVRLGRLDEAEPLYADTLRVWSDKFGEDHPDVGIVETNLGDLAMARGKPEEAVPHYQRALDLFSEAYGEDSSDLGYSLVGLSRAHTMLGRPEEGLRHVQRAKRVRGDEWIADGDMLLQELALAEALAASDPERANEVAQAALDASSRADPRRVAMIEAFLEAK